MKTIFETAAPLPAGKDMEIKTVTLRCEICREWNVPIVTEMFGYQMCGYCKYKIEYAAGKVG